MSSSPSFGLLAVAAVLLALNLAQHGSLAATVGPRVIVVGAGMSGNNKAPIRRSSMPWCYASYVRCVICNTWILSSRDLGGEEAVGGRDNRPADSGSDGPHRRADA
jgi:hypothetical protein